MVFRRTKWNSAKRWMVISSAVILMFGASHRLSAQTYHPTVEAQSYDNAFSIMLHNSNVWRNDFYNDIISANASKGMFGSVSKSQRITQQEIQNLCKPFTCVGEKPSIMPPPSQAPAAAPRALPQYPITATDFKPVGGRLMPDEISRASQGTAEQKEALRSLSNHLLDDFENEGRRNNVANSFAWLTGVSMQIMLRRELSEAEVDQLIVGFNNSLGPNPQFAAMPARDKQILYETASIAGGMISFLDAQGKQNNDAKMQSDARTMARAVLVSMFGIRIE